MLSIPRPPGLNPVSEDDSGVLAVLAAALDERDAATNQHCDRVSRLALAVGERCGLPAERLHHLTLAARFHDVGKIGIRDEVLLHPGQLDEAKLAAMNTHPERGARLFAATGRGDAAAVARLILHHHEAWDGSGYPHGLQGEEIPLEARILTLADGFDALTSHRPYRGPLGADDALAILDREKGRRLDQRLFDEFRGLLPGIAG